MRSVGRSKLLRLALAYSFICGQLVLAAPQGEQVTNGQATFNRQGSLTEITASNNAIINYQQFNIASGQTIQLIQPDSSSRVLNRVLSSDPTRIDGSLLANGQVYIVNPSGVFFGSEAIINTAGLFAAAADISNDDFLNQINLFTNVRGSVINQGTIESKAVYLIGRQVANFGTILSPNGVVVMAARLLGVLRFVDLRIGCATEFAAPNHQRVLEHPAAFEIRQQRCCGSI